jgi:hypothetical protein
MCDKEYKRAISAVELRVTTLEYLTGKATTSTPTPPPKKFGLDASLLPHLTSANYALPQNASMTVTDFDTIILRISPREISTGRRAYCKLDCDHAGRCRGPLTGNLVSHTAKIT